MVLQVSLVDERSNRERIETLEAFDVTSKTFGQTAGTERTDAIRKACDAAQRAGGVVYLPSNGREHVLRRAPAPFRDSGALGERSVYVRGDGWGASRVLWRPDGDQTAEDVFVWGDGARYVGGGASGLLLLNPERTAAGAGLWSRTTIFQSFRDVWVRGFRSGCAMDISSTSDADNCQGITLNNVHLQDSTLGLYCRYGAAISATALHLNQNTTNGIIEFGGGFTWHGGHLQGVNSGPSLLIGRGNFTAGVVIVGVHIENNTTVAIECDAAKHVLVQPANWGHRAGQVLVDAKHSSIVDVRGTGAVPGALLVRGRSGAQGIIRDCQGDGSDIDLDSSCAFVLEPYALPSPAPIVAGARWR